MSFLRSWLGQKPTDSAIDETAPVVEPPAPVDRATLFVLPSEALVGISGESHYPDAIRALARSGARDPSGLQLTSDVAADVARREPRRKLRWFEAQLLPMPDNPYDGNAVAVLSPHGQVGYLPRERAAEYAEIFTRLRQLGYQGALCPAFLDVAKGAVVLALSWPSFILPKINAERHKRAWDAWQAGEDLEAVAAQLGFSGASKVLVAARRHAKENGLSMPPTATELRRHSQ
jgi:hypothetical protein